ncbi:MAG: glucokinase [Candidatus Poriferisodalaceae bacterium]
MIVGIDIGGTKALAVLVDPASNLVEASVVAPSSGSAFELVESIVDLITYLDDQTTAPIDAVGLAVAGLVTPEGSVRHSPHLPSLLEFPLGERLSNAIGLPVVVANDATAGTIAEAEIGAGKGCKNFVFVALGTGIGTGLVVDGHLLKGSNGFAGESGHMTINYDGDLHVTDRRGPWEMYGSGRALTHMVRQAISARTLSLDDLNVGHIDDIVGSHLVSAMTSGNKQAEEIFSQFCKDVAIGMSNLVMVVDPSLIVIGGGLANIGSPLIEGVRDWLLKIVVGVEHRDPVRLELSPLGSDGCAIGAALLTKSLVNKLG